MAEVANLSKLKRQKSKKAYYEKNKKPKSTTSKCHDAKIDESISKEENITEKKPKAKVGNSPVPNNKRPKKEIEYITRQLKVLRKKMFEYRILQMSSVKYSVLPEYVTYFRAMKEFFNNPRKKIYLSFL